MNEMSAPTETRRHQGAELDRIVDLFGGPSVLKHRVSNSIDAHEMILHGIPSKALATFVSHLVLIDRGRDFESALGMSERTFQRHKSDLSRTLSKEQSARTWVFARILMRATAVFGSQDAAEKWMIEPAIGLDDQRPIDLLTTPAGSELVEEFLERLDFGVYA